MPSGGNTVPGDGMARTQREDERVRLLQRSRLLRRHVFEGLQRSFDEGMKPILLGLRGEEKWVASTIRFRAEVRGELQGMVPRINPELLAIREAEADVEYLMGQGRPLHLHPPDERWTRIKPFVRRRPFGSIIRKSGVIQNRLTTMRKWRHIIVRAVCAD
jgi:hypothetical protein